MKPVGSCYVFSFHDDGASLNDGISNWYIHSIQLAHEGEE